MSDPQCCAQLVGRGTRCPYPAQYVQVAGGGALTLRFLCGVHRTRRRGFDAQAVPPAWTDLDPSWLPVLIETLREYHARLIDARWELHQQAAENIRRQRAAEAALRAYQTTLDVQNGLLDALYPEVPA